MKKNKMIIMITSLLCLLPLVFSVVIYQSLPDQIAIHWDSAGVADNDVHKAVAAFGLPVIFLAINLFSKMRLLNDPKEGPSRAIKQLSIWLIPAMSIVLVPVTLAIAMGADIPIVMISTLLVGLLLVVVGNYLPKSRQNYTIGIKLPWTLSDVDNWNKTHRLAGYLWIAGGVILIISILLLSGPFAQISVTVIIVLALVLIPAIYSYSLYKRENVEIMK